MQREDYNHTTLLSQNVLEDKNHWGISPDKRGARGEVRVRECERNPPNWEKKKKGRQASGFFRAILFYFSDFAPGEADLSHGCLNQTTTDGPLAYISFKKRCLFDCPTKDAKEKLPKKKKRKENDIAETVKIQNLLLMCFPCLLSLTLIVRTGRCIVKAKTRENVGRARNRARLCSHHRHAHFSRRKSNQLKW